MEPRDAASPLTPGQFVGRSAELAALAAAHARLLEGHGGVAWIEGAPGMGKTRLAAKAFPQELQPPAAGGPFASFATALTPHLPRLLASPAADRLGPLLARIIPGCWPEPARALDPQREAARLQAALVAAVAELATGQGLVLVLEDWHAADPLSLQLAERLAPRAAELPALLVFTSRPEARPGWLAATAVLELPPLAEPELAQLAAACLGEAAPPDLVADVVRFSGGNPLLAEQFLAHQQLVRRVAPAGPAGDVAGLVAARMAPAGAATSDLAALLAVLGDQAELEILAAAAGLGAEEARDGLAVLVDAKLAVEVAPGRFRLAHERIADALLGWFPDQERARWHAAAARALDAAEPGEAATRALARVAAIATHALAADLPDLAIPHAMEAGRRLAGLYANDEAERLLAAGLDALKRDGRAVWRHERLAGLQALGDVRRVTGRFAPAREAYDEALLMAEAMADRAACGRILGNLAKLDQGQDDLAGALARAAAAQEASLWADDPAEASRAAMTCARVQYFRGDAAAAREAASQALALGREAEDPSRVAEALAFVGYLQTTGPAPELAAGIAALHESIALLTALSDKAGLAQAYMLLGDAQASAEDLGAARTSFNLARWICQEAGNRTEEGIALLNLAVTALGLGELAEAGALAEAAEANARALPNGFQAVTARVLGATAAVLAGRVAGAHDALTGALAEGRGLESAYLDRVVLPWAAEAFLALGRLEDAREAGLAMQRALDAGGADAAQQAGLDAWLAEAFWRLGEPAAAAFHADRANRAATAGKAGGELARVARRLAWLALQREDWPEATRTADLAAACAARRGDKLTAAAVEGLRAAIALGAYPDAALGAAREAAVAGYTQVATTAAALGARALEAEAWQAVAALEPDAAAASRCRQRAAALAAEILAGASAVEAGAFASGPARAWLDGPEALRAVPPAGIMEPERPA
jgi:hypothetical protein